jgi:hypothetical protein
MIQNEEQTFFELQQLGGRRWPVSYHTVRRLVKNGLIRTVYIGARRLVPLSEVLRIEAEGVGKLSRTPKAK